jgi:hypothetical protein
VDENRFDAWAHTMGSRTALNESGDNLPGHQKKRSGEMTSDVKQGVRGGGLASCAGFAPVHSSSFKFASVFHSIKTENGESRGNAKWKDARFFPKLWNMPHVRTVCRRWALNDNPAGFRNHGGRLPSFAAWQFRQELARRRLFSEMMPEFHLQVRAPLAQRTLGN